MYLPGWSCGGWRRCSAWRRTRSGWRAPADPEAITPALLSFNFNAVACAGYPRPYLSPLRWQAFRWLAAVNPAVAASFAPLDEMDAYLDAQRIGFARQAYCAAEAQEVVEGIKGWSAISFTALPGSAGRAPAPRPALRDNPTPALALRGECSFIAWEAAYEYREILPDARLVYVEDAGHFLWGTQADLAYQLMRAFLLDEPLPVAAYEGSSDPAG